MQCRAQFTAQGWLLLAGREELRKAGTFKTADNWAKLNGLSHRTLPKFSAENTSASTVALLLPPWVTDASSLVQCTEPLDTKRVMHILRDLLSLYRTLWMRDLHIPLLTPKDILYNAELLLVLPFRLETYRVQTPEPPADPAEFSFASPELMDEPEQVGPASGIYNLGMLALFMLHPAAFSISGLGMSQLLQWKRPPLPSDIDPEVVRLLDAMLHKDPSLRPSGPDALYVDVDRCCERLEGMRPAQTESHREVRAVETKLSNTEPAAIPKKEPEPVATPVETSKPAGNKGQAIIICIRPGCGTAMQPDALFCRICGTFQQPVGNRICPHCGAAVPAGLTYCNQCERMLNG